MPAAAASRLVASTPVNNLDDRFDGAYDGDEVGNEAGDLQGGVVRGDGLAVGLGGELDAHGAHEFAIGAEGFGSADLDVL